MIKDFVTYWNKNKDYIAEYMKTHDVNEYADSYLSLVKLIFDKVINPELSSDGWLNYKFNTGDDEISQIDDGDYQGSFIYLLHRECYQPSPDDYVFTTVD